MALLARVLLPPADANRCSALTHLVIRRVMVPQKVADLKERDLHHPAIERCSVQHLSTSRSRVLGKPGNSSNAKTDLKRRRKSPHSPNRRRGRGVPNGCTPFSKSQHRGKSQLFTKRELHCLDTHYSNRLLCVRSLSQPLLVLRLEHASPTTAMLDQVV
jgi:hypothetical protein